jgi:GNAT superfamily N-acetyltransferase
VTAPAALRAIQALPRDGSPDWPEAVRKACGPEISVQLDRAPCGHVILSRLRTAPKLRNHGHARETLRAICALADAAGDLIALTPEPMETGTSIKRLRQFFAKHGFRLNKGRTADPVVSELLVRKPFGSPAAIGRRDATLTQR